MFDMFNIKLNKALDLMETEIEGYKLKEKQCSEMINNTDIAKLEDLAQMESWKRCYQNKREALEEFKSHLEQYVF